MVSPLFVEIYGALIFLSLLRIGALFSANKEETKEFLKTIYNEALENPSDPEKIYFFGHLYYSLEFPDKKTFLDFIFNNFDSKGFKDHRESFISQDLINKRKKVA